MSRGAAAVVYQLVAEPDRPLVARISESVSGGETLTAFGEVANLLAHFACAREFDCGDCVCVIFNHTYSIGG